MKLMVLKSFMMCHIVPKIIMPEKLSGTKQILDMQGTEGLLKWVKDQNKLLLNRYNHERCSSILNGN